MISFVNTSGNIKLGMQKTKPYHFWLLVCAHVPQSKHLLLSEGVYRYIFGRTHKAINTQDGCSRLSVIAHGP